MGLLVIKPMRKRKEPVVEKRAAATAAVEEECGFGEENKDDSSSKLHTRFFPDRGLELTSAIDRETLRAYMLTHSLKGARMLKKRSRGMGKPEEVASPLDPDVKFRIKHIGVGEMIEHRDSNAKVRYTTRDGDNGIEYISEREFPEGTGQMETILRCLAGWDIADEVTGLEASIDEANVNAYLDPEEFDFVYQKCLEINPILLGVGGRKRKINSDPGPTDRSTDGEDDPSAVRPLLPAES